MKLIVEKIIIELVNARKGLTAGELAERIGTSESNIKHNINFAKDELKRFGLGIRSIPSEGFAINSISGDFEENIIRLRGFMANDPGTAECRKNYILDTLLNYEKNYSVRLFVDELYVSRSVILNDLDNLNELLERFHIKFLVKKNKGIVIDGNEFEIRQAITFFQNKRLFKTDYLKAPREIDPRLSDRAWTFITEYYAQDVSNIVAIQQCIEKAEKYLDTDFMDIAYGRLLEYILITQKRIKRGKYIKEDLPGERLDIEEKYLEAADFFKPVFSNPRKEDWKYERMFLAARLYVALTVDGNKKVDTRDRKVARRFLNEIRNSLDAAFELDSDLIDRLADLINTVRYRTNYKIYDWLDISHEVRRKYTSLYALCMLNISLLEGETGLEFQKDDIAILVLNLASHMQSHKKKAVFVTASTVEQSNYNLNKLREKFPYLDFCECVYYKDFHIEDYSNMLIISSVNIKGDRRNLIRITKHVSLKDIETIQNRLVQINKDDDIISRIYQEQLIIDLVAIDKEDALLKIAEHMEKCGYTEEGFYEELIKREDNYPTVIGKGLAIPHAYLKKVKKSGVAVVRLKNKAKWSENDWADIIFCFAISDESAKDIREIFRHMYQILKNEDLINKIRTAEDRSEILSLLLNDC